MPIQNCQLNNKPGFKWGNEGKCYTYTPGNKTSMDNAKKKVMEQAVAIEQFADSYSDYPKQATENAKIALRWAEENGWGSCGTAVGKARANQLANGENISRETIARMAAFERHRQNSQKELGDGCGRLMWLAWGGDAGIEWAQRKLVQIDKKVELAAKKISFDYDDTLSLSKYQEKAKQLIADGNIVYIISARHNASNMFSVADKVGIPHSRIYATGSNKNKIEKIKELNIDIHYDNNQDVIDELKRNHIGTHKAELDSQVQRMSDIMKFIKNK